MILVSFLLYVVIFAFYIKMRMEGYKVPFYKNLDIKSTKIICILFEIWILLVPLILYFFRLKM